MIKLPLLQRPYVSGKTVFLRADFNVPLSENQKIEDATRLTATLPTIRYLRDCASRIIIASHLGRPEKKEDKYSLLPIALWLKKELGDEKEKLEIENFGEFPGWRVADDIFLLENLRFFEGETSNNTSFAKKLASFSDVYVNDAFGVCHRENASIVEITKYLPHFAGLLLEKEVEALSSVLVNPQRPLVVVVGGAKIETKLPLIDKMHDIADYVLVGGKLVQETKTLVQLQHDKNDRIRSALLIAELNDDGKDITQESLGHFLHIIDLAKTVVWTGTVGKVEDKDGFRASEEIANAIIKSGAYSVVGGGDTLGFLSKINLLHKFSFASTGGGAMLAFLSGEKLPGLEALIH